MNDYDFSSSVVGHTNDGRDVLDVELMISILMDSGDFEDSLEAQEYIDWNASFGNSNVEKPAVLFYEDQMNRTCNEYIEDHDIEDAYAVEYLNAAFIGTTHGGSLCYDFDLSVSLIRTKLKTDNETAEKVLKDIIIPLSKNTSLNEPIFILKSLDK